MIVNKAMENTFVTEWGWHKLIWIKDFVEEPKKYWKLLHQTNNQNILDT